MTSLSYKIMESFSIIQYTFKNWNIDNIFICFNGGKDSTLLLHLIYSIFLDFKFSDCSKNHKLTILYLKNDPIDEVEEFLYQTILFYNAKLVEINASNGLIFGCHEFSKIYQSKNICFLGTRQLDYKDKYFNFFQPTDPQWPFFIRVQPILNFTYSDVWSYLKNFNVPYCNLYSKGFTSLGSLSKTRKNEDLRIKGSDCYLHASELINFSSEREYR